MNSGSPIHGGCVRDFQWMPEIGDSTEPHMCYVVFYTYMPMIELNLQIRQERDYHSIIVE